MDLPPVIAVSITRAPEGFDVEAFADDMLERFGEHAGVTVHADGKIAQRITPYEEPVLPPEDEAGEMVGVPVPPVLSDEAKNEALPPPGDVA